MARDLTFASGDSSISEKELSLVGLWRGISDSFGAAGFRSTPAILIDPLKKEFGWGRGTIGTAVSINVLLYGFIGPFAAALQMKYGLRRITIWALSVISIGALLTTQISTTWHLYLLWGGVVGTGSGCLATVFASTVATRWFVKNRGLVVGGLTAAVLVVN